MFLMIMIFCAMATREVTGWYHWFRAILCSSALTKHWAGLLQSGNTNILVPITLSPSGRWVLIHHYVEIKSMLSQLLRIVKLFDIRSQRSGESSCMLIWQVNHGTLLASERLGGSRGWPRVQDNNAVTATWLSRLCRVNCPWLRL